MCVKSIEFKKIESIHVRNFFKKVSTDLNFLFNDKNDTNQKIFNFFVLCIMALYLAQNSHNSRINFFDVCKVYTIQKIESTHVRNFFKKVSTNENFLIND